jgi:hypothetical protein
MAAGHFLQASHCRQHRTESLNIIFQHFILIQWHALNTPSKMGCRSIDVPCWAGGTTGRGGGDRGGSGPGDCGGLKFSFKSRGGVSRSVCSRFGGTGFAIGRVTWVFWCCLRPPADLHNFWHSGQTKEAAVNWWRVDMLVASDSGEVDLVDSSRLRQA